MSITLELTELSPELEKQLSAMSEEERGRFAVSAMQRELSEREEEELLQVETPNRRPVSLSQATRNRLLALGESSPKEPTERMKKALENHRRLAYGDA